MKSDWQTTPADHRLAHLPGCSGGVGTMSTPDLTADGYTWPTFPADAALSLIAAIVAEPRPVDCRPLVFVLQGRLGRLRQVLEDWGVRG